MTLYEINKIAYSKLPTLTRKEVLSNKDSILQYITTFNQKYFILLNNESHYYTIFFPKNKALFLIFMLIYVII